MKYLLAIALFAGFRAGAEEADMITVNKDSTVTFLNWIERAANLACLDGVTKTLETSHPRLTKQEKEFLILYCSQVGSEARKKFKIIN